MTKETRELTEQIAEFGAGMNAYKNGDGHLYLTSSKDWQDGYREAFDADLPSRYFDGSGFQAELAWDQHYADDIERVTTGDLKDAFSNDFQQKPATIKGTAHEFIINTLSDPPRVICLAAIVGIGIGETIYQVVFVGGMR